VHGPGVQEPIVTYEAGTKNWLYADLQGSIVAKADTSGAATDTQGYGPFGEPDADIGAGPGPNSGGRFGFTGALRLHEATPDLHQMGERTYSASLGRFIEPDPIGTADDINLYGYAAGDPINLFDPTGLWGKRNERGLDTFQTGLDYAGFAPGVGAAPDLLNATIYAARGQWGNAALSAVAAVPGWGDAIKGGAMAGRATRGGLSSVRLGQAGEAAVRQAVDIGPATRITINGVTRIPDGLTSRTLSEVKNVSSLSYTRQLRDYSAFARKSGRQFDLYVRPDTEISGPLLKAVRSGEINLRLIPGT
jgi:RHS repeat-associated protein